MKFVNFSHLYSGAMAEKSFPNLSPKAVDTDQKNTLTSRSGDVFYVSDSILRHSHLLETMNSVLDSQNEPFPLPNVTTPCLKTIISFVESNPSLCIAEVHSCESCTYLSDLSLEQLRELLLAANYMDMPVLLQVVSRTIGERFRDTPLESLAERVGFQKPDANVVRKEYMKNLVLHFLSSTSDLCIFVLDYAEVWNSIVIRTDAPFKKGSCTELYLRMNVLDSVINIGPRRLEISVDSHDQGWSSYPNDHNTRTSWTWGEVWVRSGDGENLYSDCVYRNLHASGNWELQSKSYDRNHEIMSHIKPGVTIDLMLCASYPGWVNNTRFAEMKLFIM